jgi:hypothetical protein
MQMENTTMINKLVNPVMLTAVLSMAVLLIAFGVITGQSESQLAAGGRLEGAWNVRVSITSCQTGAVIRSFDSITTFNQGGTVVDSTSGMPQALKTPGHGVWAHTAGQSYAFRFKNFNFDQAGNYTGYTIIQHEAELDKTGDAYTSAGTAEVFAPNGTPIVTGCSTTTASRMTL